MTDPASSAPPPAPASIGLCLSGGGYRAAAFHLGALACLDRAGLLGALKAVSTVSGGTFTGSRYALALAQGAAFAEFFRSFYDDLATYDLLKLGLDQLGGEAPEVPSERHDLIVSLASVYARTFFASGSEPRKPYVFADILDAPVGIEEIALNATEFRYGLAFRFQKSRRGRIGNGRVSIPRAEAAKIRLADIVAASSCFPGGFEPLAFPDDFVWPDNRVPDAVRSAVGDRPLALMDGGIYDNQGIDSLLLADERAAIDLDLFIISDVDQRSRDMYPFPEGFRNGGVSLGALNVAAWLLMASSFVTALLATRNVLRAFGSGAFTFLDVFEYLVPMFLAGLTAYALFWVRRALKREIARIPRLGRAAWTDLKRIRVGQLLGMVRLRVGSLFAMASDVFMARVRALVYGQVYRDAHYEERRVSNLIYDLTPSRPFYFATDPRVPPPSRELVEVVEAAASMPTTLWFDDDRQLPGLVAAGDATLCYNLMKHLARRFGRDTNAYPEPARALWERLLADWKVIVREPYVFVRALTPESAPGPAGPRASLSP